MEKGLKPKCTFDWEIRISILKSGSSEVKSNTKSKNGDFAEDLTN